MDDDRLKRHDLSDGESARLEPLLPRHPRRTPGCVAVEPPYLTEDGTCLVGISKWEYVTNLNTGTVTPINTATNTALKPLKGVGPGPCCIAITPNGKTAYVSSNGMGEVIGHTVTPIRTATNTALKPITP